MVLIVSQTIDNYRIQFIIILQNIKFYGLNIMNIVFTYFFRKIKLLKCNYFYSRNSR